VSTLEDRLERAQRVSVGEAAAQGAARFVKAAEKEKLVDVVFARVGSPFGELLIA